MLLREEGDIEGRIAETTESAKGLDVAFGAVGKTLGIAGAAIGIVGGIITAALLVPLGKSIKVADEFVDTLGDLSASTGTTKGETEGLGKSLKNVYKAGYGDDIRDVAEAMKQVKQQTGLTGKALEDQTKSIITLSKKMDVDYGEAVKTVDNLTKNLNITSEEAFELIVQGWENGLNANGDYLDVLNEYAVQIKKAGLTTDEFFSIMMAGHENGVFSLDKLIDAQKEFNIRSIDGSKGTLKAYDDLDISYKKYSKTIAKGGEEGKKAQQKIIQALLDEDDQVKQNEIGVALFGTMWEDLGPKGISSLLGIDNGMDKTKNHMDELNKTNFDSLDEALKVIGRTLEMEILLPVSKKIVPVLVEGIKNIKDKATDLTDHIQAKFKPLFDFINDNADDVKKALEGLFEFMVNGNFDQSFEKMKEALKNIFPNADIDDFVLKLAGLRETIEIIIEKISDLWDSESMENYMMLLEASLPTIEEMIGNVINAYFDFMDAIGDFAQTPFFDEIIASIERLVLLSLPALVGGVELFIGMGTAFYDTASFIVKAIDWVGNTFLVVKEKIKPVTDFLIHVGKTILDGLLYWFKKLYDKLVGNSIVPDLVNDIIKWFSKLPGKIAGLIKDLVSKGIDKFNSLKDKAISTIKNMVTKLINKFKDLVSKGRDKFEDFKKAITKKLKSIDLYDIGADIVQGLIDGLGSLLQSVKNKAAEIAKAVEKALKDKLKLKSPSKVMYDIGVNIVEGLNLGLKDNIGISKIKQASDVIYNNLTPQSTNVSNVNRTIQDVFNINMKIDPSNYKDLDDFIEMIKSVKKYKSMMGSG
jgi:phage-related minor tail protein